MQEDGSNMGVTGIGGVFFRARDPEALSGWYREHLGIGGGEYNAWEQQAGQTLFNPFPADTDYFPAEKQWMINFRVEGLDAMKADLAAQGIEVITNPEWDAPGVGRFARVFDPEGNQIELWEPD
jgi:predicted enzyme related to lactoylglutathione lyase